jgi:hypothetical protein
MVSGIAAGRPAQMNLQTLNNGLRMLDEEVLLRWAESLIDPIAKAAGANN